MACEFHDQCIYGVCSKVREPGGTGACTNPPTCRGVRSSCNGTGCCAATKATCQAGWCCLGEDARCQFGNACCSGSCVSGLCE